MKLVLSIVLLKLLIKFGSSNDFEICKDSDISVEDDEKCSTNIVINNEAPLETESKGGRIQMFD